MARKQNSLPSVKITVSTTPAVRAYLSALVSTGLYGKNPADAADRLLAKGIEQAVLSGTIAKQNNVDFPVRINTSGDSITMVMAKDKMRPFGALSSVRANIPTLALQAANELDEILNKRATNSPTSKRLGEILLNAVSGNKASARSGSSVRSGTVAVFCHALDHSHYERRVDTMSDFIEVATKISQQLEAASAPKSELERLKQFCLALARASALYRPSAYSCTPQLVRR